ncbi:uncharacterized protein LOC130903809 [Diorhabda carinulata]|uniref:uncharacterized protein LOC130903809 n=1 Tax=Diorhabda carinulata TaxID=1163345 RepID=UPI0025A0EDEC|nr:uncharacterized protein LOC130903809 [Diorhabda carinulata]
MEETASCDSETDDAVNNLLRTVRIKQYELSKKIINLKASTETLKEQLIAEKKKWLQEIQETLQLERRMKNEQIKSMVHLDESEKQRKLEIFKEYLFFTTTTMNLEKELKKKNYQDWLSEIANECNHELSRVQDSLTVLKPLKDMASKWSFDENQDQINETQEKGQGDASTEQENTNMSVEPLSTD